LSVNVLSALQAQVEALAAELKRSVEVSDLTISHLKVRAADGPSHTAPTCGLRF
jgi:hypothetical protein